MIVAQARLPAVFTRDYGVPDTVDGRFDLIVLHLALVLRRLAQPGDRGDLGQRFSTVSAAIWTDNLREMGVGDLKVPKEMQRDRRGLLWPRRPIGGAWPPAAQALAEALARNVYGRLGRRGPHGSRPIFASAARPCREQTPRSSAPGDLRFPEPELRRCDRAKLTRTPANSWSVPVDRGRHPGHRPLITSLRRRRDARGASPGRRVARFAAARPATFDLTRHGARRHRVVGQVNGHGRADLRGHARADRERDRGDGRSSSLAPIVFRRRPLSRVASGHAQSADERAAGTSDRRHRRPRRWWRPSS